MRLDRATVCLPTRRRRVAQAFYAALGFAAVRDGPLQFEISAGLRVMLVPTIGFGWLVGGRKRSPRGTHECLLVIGLRTEGEVDELLRRAKDEGGRIVIEPGSQKWGYGGAFADPDGHVWQVGRADGFLSR